MRRLAAHPHPLCRDEPPPGSFLCGRTQHLRVDGKASEEVEITYGVLQESVLGPIFFLININYMAEYTNHSSVRQFANDTIIYITENDCKKLQEYLQALKMWYADWLMEFHPDKWSVIRITRNKTHIVRCV